MRLVSFMTKIEAAITHGVQMTIEKAPKTTDRREDQAFKTTNIIY